MSDEKSEFFLKFQRNDVHKNTFPVHRDRTRTDVFRTVDESVMMQPFFSNYRLLVIVSNPTPAEVFDVHANHGHRTVLAEEVFDCDHRKFFWILDAVVVGQDVKSVLACFGANDVGNIGWESK